MRYKLGETEDTYFVSGHGVKKIEKILQKRNEEIKLNQVKRDRYAVFSDQITSLEFYSDFMSSINIRVKYDFENFNNFIEGNSKGLLKKLFDIAYSNDKFDDSFIRETKQEINRLKSILPDVPSEVHFDDVILSDDFFLDTVEELQSNFEEQSNIRFNFDYVFNSIEDKRSTEEDVRKRLQNLSKNLFLSNYAASIPKTYVSFLLNKFSGEKNRSSTSGRLDQETRNEIQRALNDYEKELLLNELRKNKRDAEELERLKRYARRREIDEELIRRPIAGGLYPLRDYLSPVVERRPAHLNLRLGTEVPMVPVVDGMNERNKRGRTVDRRRVRCIQ
jgi:hypothetical protein